MLLAIHRLMSTGRKRKGIEADGSTDITKAVSDVAEKCKRAFAATSLDISTKDLQSLETEVLVVEDIDRCTHHAVDAALTRLRNAGTTVEKLLTELEGLSSGIENCEKILQTALAEGDGLQPHFNHLEKELKKDVSQVAKSNLILFVILTRFNE